MCIYIYIWMYIKGKFIIWVSISINYEGQNTIDEQRMAWGELKQQKLIKLLLYV